MFKILKKVFFITFLVSITGCYIYEPYVSQPKIKRKDDAVYDLTKLMISFTPKTNIPKYELHLKNEFEKLLKPHNVEVVFVNPLKRNSIEEMVRQEGPSHFLIIVPSHIEVRDAKRSIIFLCKYKELKSSKEIFDGEFMIQGPIHVKAGNDRAQSESALLAENLFRELLYKK